MRSILLSLLQDQYDVVLCAKLFIFSLNCCHGNNVAVSHTPYISVYFSIDSLKSNSSHHILLYHHINVYHSFVGELGMVALPHLLTTCVSYSSPSTINLTVISFGSVKYHDCVNVSVFAYVQFVYDQLYFVPFHHTKYCELNIFVELVPPHTIKLSVAYIVSNLLELLNICCMLVTLLVSQLLKSTLLKLPQLLNI